MCLPYPVCVGCSFVAWAPVVSGHLSPFKLFDWDCAPVLQKYRARQILAPSPNFQNGWKKLCVTFSGVFYVVCFRLVVPSLRISKSDTKSKQIQQASTVQHSIRPVGVFLYHSCRSGRPGEHCTEKLFSFTLLMLLELVVVVA